VIGASSTSIGIAGDGVNFSSGVGGDSDSGGVADIDILGGDEASAGDSDECSSSCSTIVRSYTGDDGLGGGIGYNGITDCSGVVAGERSTIDK
jgi:hypothetical protein